MYSMPTSCAQRAQRQPAATATPGRPQKRRGGGGGGRLALRGHRADRRHLGHDTGAEPLSERVVVGDVEAVARPFPTKQAARQEIARFIDWYNRIRRHSSFAIKSPVEFEAILAARAAETGREEKAA
jgi:Integrase core domain